ncbi:sensor histidine kinase [Spirosoma validum]|uniref:Histidine kinase n=1 Tax=Spirosoma validum TaxID=2771355 RepID=A0A927AYA1_9BACT|nr:histidine kinase [Spirosoma validum]MBD2752076.1 histidine kinase [Spirosoma validum]
MPSASAISSSSWSSVLTRWFWNRELRLLLIHYGIWVVVSLLFVWFESTYLSADTLQKISPTIVKYRNDWGGYVRLSLIADLLYVLPVHASYWLYKVLIGKGKTWSIVLFVLYFISYALILSVLTGMVVGYFSLPLEREEALATIFLIWAYTLVFITVRAYRENRRRQRDLEKQKIQAELQALKAQVNPHFMFNTLNNLYGTALSGDADRTAAGIEQLSSVMRHVTEASHRDFIPVDQELRFVGDIVELHQMRLPRTDTIRIKTEIDWDEQPAQIVPLLLNPLIENAFKYGISIQHPCFVHIRLQVKTGTLYLTVENSILPRTRLEKGTGLGLVNVRQRLALAYPERHTLRVEEGNGTFLIDLTINL